MRRRYLREAALTDVGRVRDHNEDNLGVSLRDNLYVVADGMGGHAAGEVASQIAVDVLIDYFREPGREDLDVTRPGATAATRPDRTHQLRLARGVEMANRRVHEMGQRSGDRRGMGTTIVALQVTERTVHIAHVGDSRIYRLRDERLEQVTQDHSWFAELQASADALDAETLSYAERYKNVITRALGMHETVEVDVCCEPLREGDLYLLCSDGLHDMVDDERITGIILEHLDDLELCCERLIAEANAQGGEDNVTVMLVQAASLAGIERAHDPDALATAETEAIVDPEES